MAVQRLTLLDVHSWTQDIINLGGIGILPVAMLYMPRPWSFTLAIVMDAKPFTLWHDSTGTLTIVVYFQDFNWLNVFCCDVGPSKTANHQCMEFITFPQFEHPRGAFVNHDLHAAYI